MPALTDSLRDEYLAAMLAGDGTHARHLVERAVEDGVAIRDICLDVLGPALEQVGTLWERGEVSVAHEHYAAQVTGGVLGALAPRMRVPPRGGRLAVVTCTEGEQHALGVQMVGEFLESAAWEVLQLGAGLPAEDLLDLVVTEQPDLIGLSTATAAMLPGAERTLALLAEADVPLDALDLALFNFGQPEDRRATMGSSAAPDPEMQDRVERALGL